MATMAVLLTCCADKPPVGPVNDAATAITIGKWYSCLPTHNWKNYACQQGKWSAMLRGDVWKVEVVADKAKPTCGPTGDQEIDILANTGEVKGGLQEIIVCLH